MSPQAEAPLFVIRRLLGGGTAVPHYWLGAQCQPSLSPNTIARLERSPLDCKASTVDNLCSTLRRLGVAEASFEMLIGKVGVPEHLHRGKRDGTQAHQLG